MKNGVRNRNVFANRLSQAQAQIKKKKKEHILNQ